MDGGNISFLLGWPIFKGENVSFKGGCHICFVAWTRILSNLSRLQPCPRGLPKLESLVCFLVSFSGKKGQMIGIYIYIYHIIKYNDLMLVFVKHVRLLCSLIMFMFI